MAKITLDKVEAARRQIDAAIRATFAGEDQAAIHSGTAAVLGLLKSLCETAGQVEVSNGLPIGSHPDLKPKTTKAAVLKSRMPGYEDALALLFPEVPTDDRTRVGRLPEGWKPWQRPAYQNLSRFDAKTRKIIRVRKDFLSALDDQIEKLIKGRREALIATGERCPFHSVRFRVALAAAQGKAAEEREEQRRRSFERLKDHRDFMTKEAQALEHFFFDTSDMDRFFNTETAPMDHYGIARPDDDAINAKLKASSEAFWQPTSRLSASGCRSSKAISIQEKKPSSNRLDESFAN